jgi:hypothetical protein
MPHLLRWTPLVPRGNQSPDHLARILEPRRRAPAGDRAGIGIHAIPVAAALASTAASTSSTSSNDARRRHATGAKQVRTHRPTRRRARSRTKTAASTARTSSASSATSRRAGDAREVRRVLKPTGRLVVGEVFFDPDFIPFRALKARAEQASFTFERRLGNALSYLARFRPQP